MDTPVPVSATMEPNTTTLTTTVIVSEPTVDSCTLKNATQTDTITVTVMPTVVSADPYVPASPYSESIEASSEISSLESQTEQGTVTQFTTINVPWNTEDSPHVTITSTKTVQRTASTLTLTVVASVGSGTPGVSFQSSADAVGTTDSPLTITEVVTTTAGETPTSTMTVFMSSATNGNSTDTYGDPPVIISEASSICFSFKTFLAALFVWGLLV